LVHRCSGASSSLRRFRFPGQYYQAETGLNQNYFRDYDPAVGRYVESDPIGLAGRSYSTYNYCAANPLKNIDPSGQAFIDCAKALELEAATLNVEARLFDIAKCGNKPDPGHIKALQQAVNRLENAYEAVDRHCGTYIGAAAALATAALVLAEAAVVLVAA
jgi:RHS repeat-associated protein